MGGDALPRCPKLLNTDINTMAITSHSNRFLVILFKSHLSFVRVYYVFVPAPLAWPVVKSAHTYTVYLLWPDLRAKKILTQKVDFTTLRPRGLGFT